MVDPFQGTYPGGFNAFLTKISADGSSLLYSSYLGGNGSDLPSSIAIDSEGDMVIGGYTSSTNFPVANAYEPTVSANQGGMYGNYGFLTKFSPDGSSLIYSTYFGGNLNLPFNCGGTPCWPIPFTASLAWWWTPPVTPMSRALRILTTFLSPRRLPHQRFHAVGWYGRICQQIQQHRKSPVFNIFLRSQRPPDEHERNCSG